MCPCSLFKARPWAPTGFAVRLAPGEQSPYQALILERVAGAESETLSGPGHFCMTEAPDAINARIKEFIETRI